MRAKISRQASSDEDTMNPTDEYKISLTRDQIKFTTKSEQFVHSQTENQHLKTGLDTFKFMKKFGLIGPDDSFSQFRANILDDFYENKSNFIAEGNKSFNGIKGFATAGPLVKLISEEVSSREQLNTPVLQKVKNEESLSDKELAIYKNYILIRLAFLINRKTKIINGIEVNLAKLLDSVKAATKLEEITRPNKLQYSDGKDPSKNFDPDEVAKLYKELDKIEEDYIVIDKFLKKGFCVPSSGSFSLGFLRLIEQISKYEISIGPDPVSQNTIKIYYPLNLHAAKSTIYIPVPGEITDTETGKPKTLLPVSKYKVIEQLAKELNIKIVQYGPNNKRDPLALHHALINGQFFCSTNLTLQAGIMQMLQAMLDLNIVNPDFFADSKILKSLIHNGVILSEKQRNSKLLTFEVRTDNDYGTQGLIAFALFTIEGILRQNPNNANPIEIFNQASAGTTSASVARTIAILKNIDLSTLDEELRTNLENEFPHIYQFLKTRTVEQRQSALSLTIAFDPGFDSLSDAVRKITESTKAKEMVKADSANNGLASYKEAVTGPAEWIKASANSITIGKDGKFKDPIVAPHNFIAIATVIIYLEYIAAFKDNKSLIRYPENAGACSLAAEMFADFRQLANADDSRGLSEKQVQYVTRLVHILQKHGLDYNILNDCIDINKTNDEADKQSKSSNELFIKGFTDKFFELMQQDLKSITPPEFPLDKGESIIVRTQTGSVGTEEIIAKTLDRILENIRQKIIDSPDAHQRRLATTVPITPGPSK